MTRHGPRINRKLIYVIPALLAMIIAVIAFLSGCGHGAAQGNQADTARPISMPPPPASTDMIPIEKAVDTATFMINIGNEGYSYNIDKLDAFIADMQAGKPGSLNVINYMNDHRSNVQIKDWYALQFDGSEFRVYNYFFDNNKYVYSGGISMSVDGTTKKDPDYLVFTGIDRIPLSGGDVQYRLRFGSGEADTAKFFTAYNPLDVVTAADCVKKYYDAVNIGNGISQYFLMDSAGRADWLANVKKSRDWFTSPYFIPVSLDPLANEAIDGNNTSYDISFSCPFFVGGEYEYEKVTVTNIDGTYRISSMVNSKTLPDSVIDTIWQNKGGLNDPEGAAINIAQALNNPNGLTGSSWGSEETGANSFVFTIHYNTNPTIFSVYTMGKGGDNQNAFKFRALMEFALINNIARVDFIITPDMNRTFSPNSRTLSYTRDWADKVAGKDIREFAKDKKAFTEFANRMYRSYLWKLPGGLQG